jgi:hypothetical protein
MKKLIIVASLLMLSGNVFAATLEERVTALEEGLNSFLENEKKRNESINQISSNVLVLQRLLDKNAKKIEGDN